MARILKIDSIEGNSNLGNPVFSNYGKMQNFQYLVLSPVKEDLGMNNSENSKKDLTKENMTFKIKKHLMDMPGVKIGAKDDEYKTLSTKEKQEQIDKILVSLLF
jgi:hypothetical protein